MKKFANKVALAVSLVLAGSTAFSSAAFANMGTTTMTTTTSVAVDSRRTNTDTRTGITTGIARVSTRGERMIPGTST